MTMTDGIQNRVVRLCEKEIHNVNQEIQYTTRHFIFLPKLNPLATSSSTSYARPLATDIILSDRKRVTDSAQATSAVFHEALYRYVRVFAMLKFSILVTRKVAQLQALHTLTIKLVAL